MATATNLRPVWVSLESGYPFPFISVCQMRVEEGKTSTTNQYVALTSAAAAVLAAELLALVPQLKNMEEED